MGMERRILKAAVLGCGPTGLLAVHGMVRSAMSLGGIELEIRVYSTKRKSPLYGCQYLHEEIPGLNADVMNVWYGLRGSVEDYRAKVYDSEGADDVAVSPQLMETSHQAWNIRQ